MTIWTPEMDDALTALWADPALSCTAIGVRLGLTKNSVCGRIGRLVLQRRGSPLGHAVVASRAGKPPVVRRKALPAKVDRAEPATVFRPRLDATCRWTNSSSYPWVFCDAPCPPGSPWCAGHRARVFVGRTAS